MDQPKLYELFTTPLYRPERFTALAKLKLPVFILYFILLNLVMYSPLSFSVLSMNNFDTRMLGIDITEDIPAWFPGELPGDCRIHDWQLLCHDDTVHTFVWPYQGTDYTVTINAPVGADLDTARSVVFKRDTLSLTLEENQTFVIPYNGFDFVDFEDVRTMQPDDAAMLFTNGFLSGLGRYAVLPLLLYSVGGLMLANIIFILLMSAATMLFRIGMPGFPNFATMLKLFVIATTPPAIIVFVLGLLNMTAFATLAFNFITPLAALLIYRRNSQSLQN
ncbi:MAG: hypothetical protein EA374_07745 [Acholeplasmatales bacterium]|nr:MAG: hypothetical protein EA374_07745 [Acholeplasmatales bacterium]